MVEELKVVKRML